jgi:diaminohydroxyphosphoribosylaminopyrimidine deaminase/5-amino-6-(5-phosphoribosylamino)uracil reductase
MPATGAQGLPPLIQEQSIVEIMENPNPQGIVELLQDKYQVQHLLVEGGPSVNYQFMEAKILDELFLTLHPSLIGKRTDLGLSAGDRVLEKPEQIKLISLNQHSEELFLRYRIKW